MSRLSFDQTFAVVATAAVVTGIVAGFWVLGTPGRQRSIAADRQRLQDLNDIAQALHNDFQAEEDTFQLPESLDDNQIRRDPLTDQPYEFRRLSAKTFELCANFATDSSTYPLGNPRPTEEANQWQHPEGRHCFELDVSEYPGTFYY